MEGVKGMQIQTTKLQSIDARHELPFSTFVRNHSFFHKKNTRKNLSSLIRSLFNILISDEKTDFNRNKIILADNNSLIKKSDESDSLQYLEDCANATRSTEAYSQCEWINKADD